MSLARKAQNRAEHWERRQAAATTPQEKVAVWFDACRMVATHSEIAGHPEVWTKLAEHLNAFYRHYTQ